MEELLGFEASREPDRRHTHQQIDDDEHDVGLKDPSLVAAEVHVQGIVQPVQHRQGVVHEETARLSLLIGGEWWLKGGEGK